MKLAFFVALAGLLVLSGCTTKSGPVPGIAPDAILAGVQCSTVQNQSCPQGYSCNIFEQAGIVEPVCIKEPEQLYVNCPFGTTTRFLESYPQQIRCEGNQPSSDYGSLEEYYDSIDYSCNTDSDCVKKDIRKCCGLDYACVNKGAVVDPQAVRELCAKEGLVSTCDSIRDAGLVYSCNCIQDKCQPGPIIDPAVPIETVLECEQAGGEWGALCGFIDPCCNFRTSDFEKECSDKSDCEGDCLVKTVQPGNNVVGYCSEWKTAFGCMEVFRAGEVQGICVD